MSNVRSILSTPPVATTVSLYLFQSWVRISAGGLPGARAWFPLGAWTGMVETRWYLAEEGVRRSNTRTWESEDTAEMRAGFEGQKDVLYVQLPIGSVLIECSRVGDHYAVGY